MSQIFNKLGSRQICRAYRMSHISSQLAILFRERSIMELSRRRCSCVASLALVSSSYSQDVKSKTQVSFLPLVEDKGTVKAAAQPSLDKTLTILEQRAKGMSARAIKRKPIGGSNRSPKNDELHRIQITLTIDDSIVQRALPFSVCSDCWRE